MYFNHYLQSISQAPQEHLLYNLNNLSILVFKLNKELDTDAKMILFLAEFSPTYQFNYSN